MVTCRRQHLFLPSSSSSSSPLSVLSTAALAGLVAVVALSRTSVAFLFPLSSLPTISSSTTTTTKSSSSSSSSSSLCVLEQSFTPYNSLSPPIPFRTDARIRGKIRSPSASSSSLWVSIESPSSAASSVPSSGSGGELLHSNSTTFVDSTLHDEDHHSIDVDSCSESKRMEVVIAIPLKEMLENFNNLDQNVQMGEQDNGLVPHLSANDESGNVQRIAPMTSAPFVSISYDDYGMVQADATTTTTIASDFSLATIQSAQEQQRQLEGEGADYPAFIKALFQKDTNGQTLASKLFNLALLAVSFGYVFVSVFNIDRGMTRGWSPAEIGMRIPLDTWASYENSLSEKPVATKTIINIVIYLLGDWLSQTLFQQKDILDFDAARTLKNGLVGMCFGPAVHEYYEFSDWILPVDGLTLGITNRAFKILMDQTIYLSVKCSIYIIAVGILNGETVENGTENVKNRLKPIMFTAWKFWPLVHCVTYGLIPARHRILWVNSVDLVWNAILASKARGDDDVKGEKESPGGGIGEGIETAENEEERNIFERIGLMLSNLDPSQQVEGDDKSAILVAGHPVEDDLSGKTIPTNTNDTISSLANIE